MRRREHTSAAWLPATAATLRRPCLAETTGVSSEARRSGSRISWSFGLEQLALDNFLDQGAHAVVARACTLEDLLELGAVGEAHWRTGSEDHQLPRKIASDWQFIAHEQALDL